MYILKIVGWFVLLLPVMVLVFDVPLSLLVSAYTKARHGEVRAYPKMPFLLALVGVVATVAVGGLLTAWLGADPDAMWAAVTLRSLVFFMFRY